MTRTCTVCSHPDRSEIDAALVAGMPYRSIAQQFAASPDAVLRHKHDHIPARLADAADAAALSDSERLLAQLAALHSKALDLLARAERTGELRTALTAIREARGCLELEAKIRGEIDERPVVNVLLAPEWLVMRRAIADALAPFTDARVAVADVLMTLEEGNNGHLR